MGKGGSKVKWLLVGGKVVRLNRKANKAFNMGDGETALKLLVRAEKAYPFYEVTYHNLGNVYIAYDKLDEAEQAFRKAIDLKPTFVEAMNDLAALLVRRGRKEEAEKILIQAIEIDPKYPYAHVNLGQLLMSKGSFTDAEKEFKKALGSRDLDERTREQLMEQMAL